jgi:hypothetical protein
MQEDKTFENIYQDLWKELKNYFISYYPNYHKSPFSTEILKISKKIKSYIKIGQYQWKYISNGKGDILDVYIKRFFGKMSIYRIESIKKQENNKITQKFLNSPELLDYFRKKVQILYDKIFISINFQYTILIPIYSLWLPENIDFFELDDTHLLRNLRKTPFSPESELYKEGFCKIPSHWGVPDRNPYLQSPSVCLEISYNLPKRMSYEEPYSSLEIPFALGLGISEYNPLNDMVKSFYDFINLHYGSYDFDPISIGDKCYIRLPEFSQMYQYMPGFLIGEFPAPRSFLDLKDKNKLIEFQDLWKKKYSEFHQNYYSDDYQKKSFFIFRHGLEMLRKRDLINYFPFRLLLLVSVFEGFYFNKPIKKHQIKKNILETDLEKNSKKYSIAHTFASVSKSENKHWIRLAEIDKGNIPDYKNQYEHLIHFIIDAYTYRNSIIHPSNMAPKLKFLPDHIYNDKKISKMNLFQTYISRIFPLFIRFTLKIWERKNIRNINEWHKYLKSLFP